MKVNYDIVNDRRNNIILEIKKTGEVNVNKLVKQFNVSKATIRRDLNHLSENGLISRVYGGAKLTDSFDKENINSNLTENHSHEIARMASEFINDGDTIFINTSTTALLVIQYITNKRVTIITNNAKCLYAKHDALVSIHLTGGELRFPKESMVGDFALNNLSKVKANKCFLGCNGINTKEGITTAVLQEAAINERMVQRTIGEIFVLCDNSKIGISSSFNCCPLDRINYLITDTLANNDDINTIKNKGVKVIQV